MSREFVRHVGETYPAGPLLELAIERCRARALSAHQPEVSIVGVAQLLDVDPAQVHRWIRSERIRWDMADRCAVRLNLHPVLIWPDYCEPLPSWFVRRRCQACGRIIEQLQGPGRPRLTCGPSCRTKAMRARRGEEMRARDRERWQRRREDPAELEALRRRARAQRQRARAS